MWLPGPKNYIATPVIIILDKDVTKSTYISTAHAVSKSKQVCTMLTLGSYKVTLDARHYNSKPTSIVYVNMQAETEISELMTQDDVVTYTKAKLTSLENKAQRWE